MSGTVYLERGCPVIVLVRWRPGAGGPRNVLIERASGARVVRPFRGLRRPRASRLQDVLRAVLALHQPGPVTVLGSLCTRHANHRYFSITRIEAADVAACTDCAATVYVSCAGCGSATRLDQCPTRRAIFRALPAEDEIRPARRRAARREAEVTP